MPDRVAAACVEFITGPLLRDPWRRGKPLSGELAGRRCARLDAFRIVYVIDEGTHVVHVTRIEHSADAYRPR
ncbi:MAG: type II toxin-antitoxin system RelE/ParE family toxin [Actinobacteria bacterium]|nr:MAG: type II toxin-antitoxin system RelE/ParE family toxin [Actinomycetota bacterium]